LDVPLKLLDMAQASVALKALLRATVRVDCRQPQSRHKLAPNLEEFLARWRLLSGQSSEA
jgi:hypothetical protein